MGKLRLREGWFAQDHKALAYCVQTCVRSLRSNISLYAFNKPLKRELRFKEVKQPATGYPGLQGLAWTQ